MLKRALSVVVSLFLWTPGYAQTLGTITGEIKDSSGASIPGSTVTAQNVATNAVRTQASNNVGAFTFPAMPPGVYLVKAELEGFKPAENRVELHVEQTLRVSFTLEIGGVAETALVTAVTPLLTTENATVGTVIENRRIVELPLNGRNYLSLIALSPNVSAGFAGAGQAGDRQGGSRANQQISISGQRREFNYYTLDGVDNTDVNFNTYIFLPSVDALEEFKVQTGIYSAEFGRAAGQVNVVTKSGSNAFHGTVFEFHRNEKFDARPYAFTAAQAAEVFELVLRLMAEQVLDGVEHRQGVRLHRDANLWLQHQEIERRHHRGERGAGGLVAADLQPVAVGTQMVGVMDGPGAQPQDLALELAQEPETLHGGKRGHRHGIRLKAGKILAFGPFGRLYRVELRQK